MKGLFQVAGWGKLVKAWSMCCTSHLPIIVAGWLVPSPCHCPSCFSLLYPPGLFLVALNRLLPWLPVFNIEFDGKRREEEEWYGAGGGAHVLCSFFSNNM